MASENENESIESIIAEMRDMGNYQSFSGDHAKRLANRIEAAWKREREPKPLTIPEWIDHEETVEDIAAVLRRYVLPSLADRLEAAWKRERSDAMMAKCEVCSKQPVGNAAAMREALVKIRDIAKTFMDATIMRHVTDSARIDVANIEALANAALFEPPRNCDVGTAAEQVERFERFCDEHWGSNSRCGDCCENCPISGYQPRCSLAWAQMPYEAEEGGAE